MKKLLFIVNVDWFFISHRLPIALAAIKQGYQVHIACGITDKRSLLENNSIIVHPLALSRSGIGIINELKTLKQLFSIIRSVKPDITHTVTIKPVLYGNIVARLLKVPVRISSISGLGYVFIASGFKSNIFRALIVGLYRFALSGSKTVIFQNNADRDTLKKFGAVKSEQVLIIRGSGVDLNLYSVLPEPQDTPVVMLVARLLIDKGVNEFAQAAEMIKNHHTDVRMVLVGDTDEENPKSVMPQQITAWVNAGIVEHWGYSQDVAATMAQANIVVLPSYREGLPKCLIEAAACGRAVITTDVPGCRDAIIPNKTGLLIPVKTVEPLVKAILTLINNKNLRFRLATKGREVAESKFDILDVINLHMDIYNISKCL